MATPTNFDATPYLRAPRLDVRQAVALAIALLSAMPKDASPGMKRAARAVRKATLEMKKSWAQKRRASGKQKPADKAKADSRIDTAWGALKMRLDACALLSIEAHPLADRAREISGALFPGGLDFLAIAMESEWAESNERLERIEEQGLDADIDAIAGREYLAEVRAAHAYYGEVLGITKAKEAPEEATALLDPLRALVARIGDYLVQAVASVDREDPETVKAVRAALRPLDQFRAAAARRTGQGGKTEEDAESDEGLPEVDPETPVPDVPQ